MLSLNHINPGRRGEGEAIFEKPACCVHSSPGPPFSVIDLAMTGLTQRISREQGLVIGQVMVIKNVKFRGA